jgi:hydrogenase nickel incorporation protein HypA/HybF
MHEYSIVASLVDRVEHEAFMRPGAIVRKLHVRIGEFAGVEPSLLQIAFETFRMHTRCEDAELAVVGVPGDDDIILERIEMEVPDV